MLAHLLTEKRNPASINIDDVPTEEMLHIMNQEDARVAAAVSEAIPQIATAVDRTADAVRHGSNLYYIGAGTSGRLGVLDASECPPTFNVPAEQVRGIMAGGEQALSRSTEASEDDTEAGAADLLAAGFRRNDVLAGIAASGRTPYVLGAIRKAREMGALTIGISCTPQSELSKSAEIGIELLVGPEVITGSTRLKAGTATKLVLNMISTGVMIRLGHVYSNLMVNVQPKNEKLRDRASRIIAEAAGVPYERAAELLAQTDSVKLAIVMAARNTSRAEAEKLLAQASGVLRAALEKSV